jgi:hypothetical protein
MENRVKDLIRFYLRKHVRETLIKLNIGYEKPCMDLYRFYLEKTYLIDINKINTTFIFRKQT